MSVKRMTDATLASRTVAAKRNLDAAKREYDALTAEVRSRATFGTVDTVEGMVTLGAASTRKGLDQDKAKVLIPDWETVCCKETTVTASVRVTFH